MSISKLFSEGILTTDKNKIGNLPVNPILLKKIYDELISTIEFSDLYKEFVNNDYHKYYLHVAKNSKDKNLVSSYFEELRAFLDMNNTPIFKLKRSFLDKYNILLNWQMALNDNHKPYEFIDQASFSVAKENTNDPNDFAIRFYINIPSLLYCIYAGKEDFMRKEFIAIYEHELIHALQNAGKDVRDLEKMHHHTAINKPKIKNMQKYAGTPAEIPAWGKSIASIIYYHSDEDYDKAINNLRQSNNVASDSSVHNEVIDYVFTQQKSGNKKAKTLLKYAYLYLKDAKQKDMDVYDMEVKK